MSLNAIRYFFRETLMSILRNSWLSLASIGIVTVSLIILGSTLLFILNANYMAGSVESSVEITVFLKSNLKTAEVQAVSDKIKAMAGVSEMAFVSKEQALQNMKKDFGDKAEVLDGLDKNNPLPDSYQVKTSNPNQVAAVAKELSSLSEVDQVRYGQGVVEKLLAVTQWIRTASMVTMVLLTAAAVFLIATSIRLSVFSRRREIGIMKFLGATNWFIRCPFILEGMCLGLVGGLLAVLTVDVGYYSLISKIQISLPFVKLATGQDTILPVLGGMLGLSLLIGAVGSTFSVRKFLKV